MEKELKERANEVRMTGLNAKVGYGKIITTK